MKNVNKEHRKQIELVMAIVAVSLILRAPITGVGSLVGMIKESLQIGSGMAGFLTTIPLLAFAVVSLFVGKLSRRLGAGYLMLGGLVILAGGILTRSYLGTAGLFTGTILIGVGIAIGNVLLPAVIKSHFPTKVGSMTSLYTTVMSACAGISGGISVPLAHAVGWKGALVVWIALTAIALISWLPYRSLSLGTTPAAPAGAQSARPAQKHALVKSGMTWWIALYMGLQSFMFYSFVAWLATIMQARGYSDRLSGYFSSAYMLLGIPGSLIVPLLAGRRKQQSGIGSGLGLIYAVGIAALLFSEKLPFLIIALICCGFCSGACISFSMALFGLHTTNAADASQLSGLAQSIGYLLAALGPVCLGQLYEQSGGWRVPLLVLLGLALVLAVLGYLAGRDKMINS